MAQNQDSSQDGYREFLSHKNRSHTKNHSLNLSYVLHTLSGLLYTFFTMCKDVVTQSFKLGPITKLTKQIWTVRCPLERKRERPKAARSD